MGEQDLSSSTSRSKNRIRSTRTERSLPASRLAIAILALGESPRTPFNYEGLRKRAAIEATQRLLFYQFSFTSSTLMPFVPQFHRPWDLGSLLRRPHGWWYESELRLRGFLGLIDVDLWEVCGLFLECWGCSGRWGFFVEIDSYAIASLTTQVASVVTRWGLFLMREVHLHFSLGL